jgi:hypothetical protein
MRRHGGAGHVSRGVAWRGGRETHELSHCAIQPAGSFGSVGSVGPESGDTGGCGGVGAAMLVLRVSRRLKQRPRGTRHAGSARR